MLLGRATHSIRRDLVVIIMTVSLLSILITSLSISAIQYFALKESLMSDLQRAADIATERTDELLPYADVPNIQRKIFGHLSVFLNNSAVSLACLYNNDEQLIAFYDAADHAINDNAATGTLSDQQLIQAANGLLLQYRQECPTLSEESTKIDKTGLIALFRPVLLDDRNLLLDISSEPQRVGSLFLRADLDGVYDQMAAQIVATMIVGMGVLILSYLLAIRLQKSISNPIQRLSDVTRKVTLNRDYTVRVPDDPNYSIEINQLMASFNGMLKDIGDRDSKLMRKNVELERAKEMAETANMSKSQFLANISHELRTPLNAIIGFSSIIINQLFGPIGNDKYVDYGKDIHDSGVHLLDIINDILDLSKAEAGKLSLRLEAFDVAEALRKCEHIISERAMEGEVKLSFAIPRDMPPIVADRVRFIQVMLNLMSNAVKFTEAGGRVDISARCENAGDEVHYFTFEVRDNGIGMRREDIDMAFQTFGQVDSGLNRKFEGTGLGLPLTKKLVELHNGSIRIDSELHHGTSVTVRFISDKALLS